MKVLFIKIYYILMAKNFICISKLYKHHNLIEFLRQIWYHAHIKLNVKWPVM